MFSDTHFHFRHLVRDRGLCGADILKKLAARDTFFALDIGTEADDLAERGAFVSEAISALPADEQARAERFMFFSAGIWPSPAEIRGRTERMKILESQMESFRAGRFGKRLVAMGEFGLDHHWNVNGADKRTADDFDDRLLEGERELFQMQIALSQKMGLPFVVHSRDAFDDTVDVLKNMGYSNGIIHCFSYGKDEARTFLDMGFYIALGGAVTYTKKSRMAEMTELLRFVPDDRILIETDAPYLAPVPFRGQTNTPVLVEYVYNFVSAARNVSPADLSRTVDGNIRRLFAL
ncbi:MAG: TatD family hydrolase [Treponema sp.]|nr:TatD family hydrolase [Treponema sp.]